MNHRKDVDEISNDRTKTKRPLPPLILRLITCGRCQWNSQLSKGISWQKGCRPKFSFLNGMGQNDLAHRHKLTVWLGRHSHLTCHLASSRKCKNEVEHRVKNGFRLLLGCLKDDDRVTRKRCPPSVCKWQTHGIRNNGKMRHCKQEHNRERIMDGRNVLLNTHNRRADWRREEGTEGKWLFDAYKGYREDALTKKLPLSGKNHSRKWYAKCFQEIGRDWMCYLFRWVIE